MFEDKLLIWKFRRGDADALRRIYAGYKDDLLRLATALLSRTSVAEDIVHDVFLDLAGSREKLRLGGNLKGYLTICVANRARNVNKTARIRKSVGLDEAQSAASSAKRPEQWIIYNERFRRLNEALDELPYEQREAIILHLHGSMTFKAVAGFQAVSINTAQSRYRYGLEKLRSILDSEAE